MILYFILCAPIVVYLIFRLIVLLVDNQKINRREIVLSLPFLMEWRTFLIDNFFIYKIMPPALQVRLEKYIKIFLSEKVFVGCNGFTITDEVKVLIAAQACLLILGNNNDFYPGFKTILVYPETYAVKETRRDGLLQVESIEAREGESWYRGPVILAWDQVLQGARNGRDGHNVVLHEFAHKLDEENSTMDGLPYLLSSKQYPSWAAVLSDEFDKLQKHRDDVIDSYGATSPAEFFAVVTEAFFEKPQQLRQTHPQLYRQFSLYYQLDPVTWTERKS